MNFDVAFDRLMGHEGGYANNPADPGGETNWGVTKRVAEVGGWTGSMTDFPRDRAKQVYRFEYWDAIKAEQLPEAIRFDVFDAAVNSGVRQSIKWLQYAIGAEPDGLIGPATLKAAQNADSQAPARFNGWRLSAMTDMGGWPVFSRGWSRRIASNLKAL